MHKGLSIKDLVSNGKMARFTNYRKGNLWYITDDGFEFPVPIEDVGDGIFKAEEKAMMLMRYIRKHKEVIEAKE